MNRLRTLVLTSGLLFSAGLALAPAANALPIGPTAGLPGGGVVTLPPPPPPTTTTTKPRVINPCAVRDCTTIPPVVIDPCVLVRRTPCVPNPTTTTTSTTKPSNPTTTTTKPSTKPPVEDPNPNVDQPVRATPVFTG